MKSYCKVLPKQYCIYAVIRAYINTHTHTHTHTHYGD